MLWHVRIKTTRVNASAMIVANTAPEAVSILLEKTKESVRAFMGTIPIPENHFTLEEQFVYPVEAKIINFSWDINK